jgi:Na+-driven multidrug efflux pump
MSQQVHKPWLLAPISAEFIRLLPHTLLPYPLPGLLPNGTVAVGAVGLVSQVYYLTWFVTYALSASFTTLAAIALGAGQHQDAKQLFRWGPSLG